MPSKNSRRLRWALLIALALHALLAWQYAGDLRARVAAALRAEPPSETVVEIASEPPPPPPSRNRWTLATKLSSGSPEDLPPPLPDNFFPKPPPPGRGFLSLSTSLSGRSLTAALTAALVPDVVRLPDIEARGVQPRAGRPSRTARPAASPPLSAAAPLEPELPPLEPQAPLRLPPVQDEADLELAIRRAAESAKRSAGVELSPRANSDLRALLPQGPLASAPEPSRRGGKPLIEPRPVPPMPASGITTYPLDAPLAPDDGGAAVDAGGDYTRNRAEYFARLTAQLKVTNQRALAEAVKATPRMTVRMKFVVDRRGAVLDVYAAETVPVEAARRATEIIRAAAPFPRIPESMVQPRLELSYPVEIYR